MLETDVYSEAENTNIKMEPIIQNETKALCYFYTSCKSRIKILRASTKRGLKKSPSICLVMFSTKYQNKTAADQKHVFWPLILLKIPFERIKAFSRTTLFLHILSDFSKFQNFLTFLKKDTTIKLEKILLRNHNIWCGFYSKFATLLI